MTEVRFTSDITVRLIDQMGSDAAIAAAAKVLLPEVYEEYQRTHEKHSTFGLLNYMMQHRHGTPFEHSALTFYVHAPIFVWREWHRHRIGFSYNEESARYKQLDPVFYLPPHDRPMFKVDGWKPGRPKFLPIINQFGEVVYEQLCRNLTEVYKAAYAAYETNLGLGIDPGLARDCLPVGIYSSCWVTCNPRSLMAFLSLRTHDPEAKFVSYPLYEIEVAAKKCEELFQQGWPLTHRAFAECGRCGP
jgi:thymidylate synthase (FAD)